MLVSLANCGSRYGDICQSKIDCEGGNDKDVDACVDELKGSENEADAYDCGDQFDDLWDCAKDKGTCKDPSSPGGRKNFDTDDKACETQSSAFENCVKAASAKKSN